MDICKEIKGIVHINEAVQGIVLTDGAIGGKISADGYIQGILGYRQCHEVLKYGGEYDVIPKTYAQHLDTDNKLMEEDVTVRAIPYYETSNVNGTTVYIGSEI